MKSSLSQYITKDRLLKYSSIAVVLVAVLFTGTVVMDGYGDGLKSQASAQEKRALEVYDQALPVSSDNCYDFCAPTATSPQLRERLILIEADRSNGWVSGFELADAVEGISVDETADRLVAAGLLEKRNAGMFSQPEYLYVGPEGKYEEGLSNDELREVLRNRLYISGDWTSFDELQSTVPAAEWRVRESLHELESSGEIQTGTEHQGRIIPWGGHTAYAHASVTSPPPGPPGMMGLVSPMILVAVLVVVIAVVRRFGSDPPTAE